MFKSAETKITALLRPPLRMYQKSHEHDSTTTFLCLQALSEVFLKLLIVSCLDRGEVSNSKLRIAKLHIFANLCIIAFASAYLQSFALIFAFEFAFLQSFAKSCVPIKYTLPGSSPASRLASYACIFHNCAIFLPLQCHLCAIFCNIHTYKDRFFTQKILYCANFTGITDYLRKFLFLAVSFLS